jgi:hypothetical protein
MGGKMRQQQAEFQTGAHPSRASEVE